MRVIELVAKSAAMASVLLGGSGMAAVGIDGKQLSGPFDPTKCRLDRDDDQFKTNEIGGQCARCVTDDQCRHAYGGFGWYCCPWMKRCVNSGSMGCYDTALCNPRCFGERYPELKLECSGCRSEFPDNWVKGCTRDDWAGLLDGGSGPVDVPENNAGTDTAGPAPEWCEHCHEDVLPTERCLDYKTQLNWCAAGYVRTMRAQCSRTCGYCDGCPNGTAKRNQDRIGAAAASTPIPTEFDGVGENCRPDRKFTGDSEFYSACKNWASQGYCESYPDLMHRDCADTCGFCERPGGSDQEGGVETESDGGSDTSGNDSASSGGDASVDKDDRTTTTTENGADKTALAKGPCGAIGDDGPSCHADSRCEWDWDVMGCVPSLDTCEAIGSDGRVCEANPLCEWNWEAWHCQDAEVLARSLGKCERIGSDKPTCFTTKGCGWDWYSDMCVADESAEAEGPKCNEAKNGRECRGKDGCKFDKSARLCYSSESAALDPCTGLKGKRCKSKPECAYVAKKCILK